MHLKLLTPADLARKIMTNSCSWTRPNVSKPAPIGVARRGVRRSGERASSVFPPQAVIQSATPADRTPRRSSLVVRVRACSRACARASVAHALRVQARLHAGAAQRAARRKGRRPAEKRVGTLNKKKALRACFEATAGGGSGV